MQDIFNEQQFIYIIPTWVMKAITKLHKKVKKKNVWGLQYFIRAEVLYTRDVAISGYFIKIHRNTKPINFTVLT